MKKQLLTILLSGMIAVPFTVSAEGAYIGGSIGRVNHKLTFDGDSSIKDHDTGYKLYGGYGFNQYFGVEGGYTHLGEQTDRWEDVAAGESGKDKFKARSIYLAAVGTIPLNESFSLFGKAGLAFNRVKANYEDNTGDSGSFSKKRTSALFGVGAAYHFNDNISVVAEYENYGKILKFEDIKLKAEVLSVGLNYQF